MCETCQDHPCYTCEGRGTIVERHFGFQAHELLGCPDCMGEGCPECGKWKKP